MDIKLLYIDLFCGAGGTSTGVEKSRLNGRQCAKVIACCNHDENAIASHAANHADTLHFTEDIRTLNLSSMITHINKQRELYPNALIVLWASLECTNFSKAKGGKPRDADSRTLAQHLFRYIEAINPDYIQIENVEEFMSWGDLDVNGKPISRDAGRCYREWVATVQNYGYDFSYRILNAANYGAYTTRKRFFGTFARKGLPIVFPEPTHTKQPIKDLFSSNLKPWKPVRDLLDFSNEGTSIFDRKKPLVEATEKRIYEGLIKFVAGGKEAFLVKYNSMNQRGRYISPGVDQPCPTVSTQNRIGVAFISSYYGTNRQNSSLGAPAPTLTTKDRLSFISTYYSGNPASKNRSIDAPAPTLTTKDRLSFIKPYFIDQQFGNGRAASINKPLGTIMTKDKYSLVTCTPWIMNTNFNNVGSSIREPSQTITADRHWHYLMNPQYSSKGGSVHRPCFTLIARMDKQPPYLMSITSRGKYPSFIKEINSGLVYEIYSTDTPTMVKIKEFMALYGIIDIKMRMLIIDELKLIMGFPKDYVLIGTQAEQKKFIGNAVEVTMARMLCEALVRELTRLNIKPSKTAA